MTEIHRLFEAVELLRRQVKKDMPSQHISLLLTVSQNPGMTMPELCHLLEMPQGTLSRNVKLLATYFEPGSREPCGLGLLYTEQDQKNRHARAVFLTERGKQVVAELACTLNPELKEGIYRTGGDYTALLPSDA